jgi:hypothetical protein
MTRWTNRLGDARPMVRLAFFAGALAVLAAAAALAGSASGIDVDDGAATEAMAHGGDETGAEPANGLSDTASGLSLRIEPAALTAGVKSGLAVTISDALGDPVTGLRGEHGEPALHLILVRRDLSEYAHVHPRRSGDGFVVDVTLPRAGVWRAYADFEWEGEKVVLGRDLAVPGAFAPQPLPGPDRVSATGGYRVELGRRAVEAGREATLTFAITRAGRPLQGLQPYLGADGHLVAIREDDLTYLHVHPLDNAGAGRVAFEAEFAEPGRYALFLQFKHRGSVRTARFTLEVVR